MRKLTTLAIAALATVMCASAQDGEKWRVVGDFHYGNATWQDTMVAYEDGTYTIQDWYGHEGYDLSFRINQDGTLHFVDFKDELNDFDHYVTFTAYETLDIGFYQDKNSGFYGDSTAGLLYFGGEMQERVTFEWPATEWSTEGQMYKIYDGGKTEKYAAWISGLSNDQYRIYNWSNGGTELQFSVNDKGALDITNGFTIGATVDNITTVYASEFETVKLYTGCNSMLKGDQKMGKVVFYDVDDTKYRLVWPLKYAGVKWSTYGEIAIPERDKTFHRNVIIRANEEGSYTISNWYTDGYDLSFEVNEDGTLHFIDGEENPWTAEYYHVPFRPHPTVEGAVDNAWLYQDSQSSFKLNEDGSGELSFVEYNLCFSTITFETVPITFKWGPVLGDEPNPYEDDSDEPLSPSAGVQGIFGDNFSVTANGADIVVPEGAVVYDVNGRVVAPRDLSNGIYIVRYGNKAMKISAGK